MDIELREITMENFRQCLELELTETQKGFVASNMFSLAEAKADGVSQPRAIYHDGEMVGFVMYWYDAANGKGWIDRLMVDVKHQGKGYGKAAMQEVMKNLQNERGCLHIQTSYGIGNDIARDLYLSLGFEDTGKTTDDGHENILIFNCR